MSKFLHIFLILFCFKMSFAQVIIKGQITDYMQQPIANVNVTVLQKTKILGFTSTDGSGNFKLEISATVDSLEIRLSKIGYTINLFTISNNSQEIIKQLEIGAIELKDLAVESPPIRKRGDTLSYKVSEFQRVSDRSIGDVIKQLPGIEMDNDGKIYYNGKLINRFYVEDMNLLDGKYALIHENLGNNKVSTVQVYEDHQPIKSLDSTNRSDRAAINLKLKNKITHTGVLQVGLGLKPFIWDGNLTPLVFTPNFQFVGSVQSNSAGNSLRKNHDNILTTTTEGWLSVVNLLAPPLSSTKWLDNSSHLGSVNVLKRSSGNLETRANFSILLDNRRERGEYSSTYYIGEREIRFSEVVRNSFQNNGMNGAVRWHLNTPQRYFKNELIFHKNWQTDEGINQRIDSEYNQNLTSGNGSVENKFHQIFSYRKIKYNLNSTIGYIQNNQSLSVRFNSADSSALPSQTFNCKGFYTNNFVDFTRGIFRKFSLNVRIGVDFALSNIKTDLQDFPFVLASNNSIQWNSTKTYGIAAFSWNTMRWNFNVSVPMNYMHVKYKQEYTSKVQKKVFPEPRLIVRYKIPGGLEFTAMGAYQNTLTQVGDIYAGSVMTSYLQLQNKDVGFYDSYSYNIGTQMNYTDAVSGIFLNAGLNYSRRTSNNVGQSFISGNGSEEVLFSALQNFSENSGGKIGVSKYLFGLKTTVGVGGNWMTIVNQRFVNQQLSAFKTRYSNPYAKISFNGLKWLESTYQFQNKRTYNMSLNSRMQLNSQILQVAVSPNTFFSALFGFEQVSLASKGYIQKTALADVRLRYSFGKNVKDIEISLNNIFNNHWYNQLYFSDFLIQSNTFQLRPRQFLLKTRISL